MTSSIQLLGGFAVTIEGVTVPPDAWRRRQAAALVKLLSLAPNRRLHREQVIDALWPDLDVVEAGPRLHKAAHFARKALGGDGSRLVLRDDSVLLLPDDHVDVDALTFRSAAQAALVTGNREEAAALVSSYPGTLLPDDLYEPWSEDLREQLSVLHTELLRRAGRWEQILQREPADEEAHLALARRLGSSGDVRGALRQLERMDRALARELGTAPSPEAVRLREALLRSAPRPHPTSGPAGERLFGRDQVLAGLRARLSAARDGQGSAVLLTGPSGVGKSALLARLLRDADGQGWRVGRGTASAVEAPWPYAPVLEAFADLCRRHPSLLDGLADSFRDEIDRALSGRPQPWSGDAGHQRLFVAAAELLRLAAAGAGLLLVVDDVHEADDASLRLLHYLARCAVGEPVVLALGYRAAPGGALSPVPASLVTRGVGTRVELAPLDLESTKALLAARVPGLDATAAERIWSFTGGLPFAVLESARRAAEGGGGAPEDLPAGLPPAARTTLQRLALLGAEFSSDELVAAADGDEARAYADLEAASTALVLEPADSGYRFRHAMVRDWLLAPLTAQQRRRLHRDVAEQLAATGAPAIRVAHHLIAAGQLAGAVPYVLTAVETVGALGAYRDALGLVDAVRQVATGADRAHLLARRGDLLMALGDPEAVSAYRAALPSTGGTEHRLVRARMARAACVIGDFDTAAAALTDLDEEGDAADGPILLARGTLSYFSGDLDRAWDVATRARGRLSTCDDPWYYVDLVSLQGLIAHNRGQWFEWLRWELRRTAGASNLATALFDAHLCVAEYMLYGPMPYAEVVQLAEGLRERARRSGALRGMAFASALIGEAALLMGDLDRAETELQESLDLHRETVAPAGEAHALQRLAQVQLARGRRAEAVGLLRQALPLARWSVISMHLLQRLYGTMITAAGDADSARAVVDRADATMGVTDTCPFCDVMLAVPAAIACADVGDLDGARARLVVAERSAALWEGTAWDAGVMEARAHLAAAEGDPALATSCLAEAARLFDEAGQPLDAARCRQPSSLGRSAAPV